MASSEINIRIDLDANRVPEKIEWQASDAHQTHPSDSKSVFVSFLDKESLDTSTLFLWTKDFQVAEMDRNVYYMLTSITEGYYRATQHSELANEMKKFVQYFGEKTGILLPDQNGK